MAVVAQLSVNLAAQTAAYEAGLKKATKDTKGFEKQVTRTQRTLTAFGATLKRALPHVGISGSIAGAVGGFQFTRFAIESLEKHAEQNRELKGTLDDLATSYGKVKERFGAWLAQVGNANGILGQLQTGLDRIAGEDITKRQEMVNTGRLDTGGTRSDIEAQLAEALRVRAALESQHRPDVANLELRRQWGLVNEEIEILQRRLAEMPQPLTGVSGLFDTLFDKGIEKAKTLGDQLGAIGTSSLMAIGDGLRAIDSGLEKATAKARDMMKAFQISQGNLSPLEIFKRDTEELQRLFDTGFLKEDAFNLALLDAQKKLEDFVGPVAELPSRASGARRGSAEAFEKVAAFQDRGQTPEQRTLQELLDETKELVRIERENAKRAREQFDDLETIDTKP